MPRQPLGQLEKLEPSQSVGQFGLLVIDPREMRTCYAKLKPVTKGHLHDVQNTQIYIDIYIIVAQEQIGPNKE